MDVVAGLDSQPNLLKLTPTEFEHLVKQLFVAMGAEAWTTIPSKDGGVDAVATSKHLFFGGVCLIQAKRWTPQPHHADQRRGAETTNQGVPAQRT